MHSRRRGQPPQNGGHTPYTSGDDNSSGDLVVFLGACGKAIYDAYDARGKLETAVTKIGSDFDKISSNNDGFEGSSWPDVVFAPGG